MLKWLRLSMDLVVVASRTAFGPLPYHAAHVFGGKPPVENRAESSGQLSALFYFPDIKRTSSEGPDNPVTTCALSTYSEIMPSQLFRLMR